MLTDTAHFLVGVWHGNLIIDSAQSSPCNSQSFCDHPWNVLNNLQLFDVFQVSQVLMVKAEAKYNFFLGCKPSHFYVYVGARTKAVSPNNAAAAALHQEIVSLSFSLWNFVINCSFARRRQRRGTPKRPWGMLVLRCTVPRAIRLWRCAVTIIS